MWLNDQLEALAALFLEKVPPVPTEMEAECTPETVWMLWWRDTSCPCREMNQSVA